MYNIKFKLKQEVYILNKSSVSKVVTCDVCDERGRIFYKNKYYLCPACHGSKTKTVPIAKWHISEKPRAIEKIHVTPSIITCEFRGSSSRYYTSGNYCVDQENCFATKSEAEQECELRNSNQEYK